MVRQSQITALTKKIVSYFKPEKIILFGSYAYGKPRFDSDVDLLVIMNFEGESFWQSQKILNQVDPAFSVDIIVRRPDETARRYSLGDPLIREAFDKGKVVHE